MMTIKERLASWSENYNKALKIGHEERADVPGLMAEKAMEEHVKQHLINYADQ